MLVDGRYGYFVDELYYLACSHHLAWGYVDQAPLIAAVTWLERVTLGDSLHALRSLRAVLRYRSRVRCRDCGSNLSGDRQPANHERLRTLLLDGGCADRLENIQWRESEALAALWSCCRGGLAEQALHAFLRVRPVRWSAADQAAAALRTTVDLAWRSDCFPHLSAESHLGNSPALPHD